MTWTDRVFNLCVVFLLWLASKFNTTYKSINVWIFCIIWPIITIALGIAVLLR
jgi:hypothetical protein